MSILIREFDSGSLLQALQFQKNDSGQPTVSEAEVICQSIAASLGYKLLGVLLFGSVARNDADEKSDIDIFVLVRKLDQSIFATIKEHVCDPGKRVIIQVIDLQGLFGAILARDPFVFGAFSEGKILKDEGILLALSEAIKRSRILPSKSTASFLFTRSKQRLEITGSLRKESSLQALAAVTDIGFGLCHLLGKVPASVNEMIEVLRSSDITTKVATEIEKVCEKDPDINDYDDIVKAHAHIQKLATDSVQLLQGQSQKGI